MSNKGLTILGIVAVAVALLAFVQARHSDKPAKAAAASSLVQGLDPEAIGSITLTSGGKEVTLTREGGKFTVSQKAGYPAQNSAVNRLINSVLDIQTANVITKDKANHGDLGVTPESAASVVKFTKIDKSPLTGVIVGKTSSSPQGTYVRLANEDTTYLTTASPYFMSSPMDYIDKSLLQVNKSDLTGMSVNTGQEKYTLATEPNATAVKAIGLTAPKGKRLKTEALEQAYNVLSSLSFDDVKQEAECKADFNRTLVASLSDSTVYTISVADANGKTWVKCTADFTDTSPVLKAQSVESQEVLKAKEAKLLAHDKATNFVNAHKGWVFEISEYQAKNLAPKVADLLEDEPNAPKIDPNKPVDPNQAKK